MFRWAKLAENAGFGYDKMLAWKYMVEFDTHIDYSEVTFYLGEKVDESSQNVSFEKTVEETEKTVEKTVEETEKTVEKTVEETEKTVEKTVEKIMEAITNNSLITQAELAEMTGLTRRGIEYNLSKLKALGLIERVGPDKGGYWKVKKVFGG
jgi:predicted HTH transcriptional regulator